MDAILNLGYIQLCDAAPLIMAGELGYYKQLGLRVRLTREVGWASVLNKVVMGQLDGAHAIGTMPIAATHGLAGRSCPCGTGLILNVGGNGITLSEGIRQRGVESAEDFRQEVRSSRWARTYSLGVVSNISTHRYILIKWLSDLRLEPDKDVRVVTVPPGQALRNLSAGTIDGFCVGDPWHSLAARKGLGWTVALGSDLFPSAPEKVLMVTRDFAEKRQEAHVALLAAVIKAAEYCQNADNAEHVASVLCRESYLGVEQAVLADIYQGRYDDGLGGASTHDHLIDFSGGTVNRPSVDAAGFFLDALLASPEGSRLSIKGAGELSEIFWEAVYEDAVAASASL